ncbi:MAG: hypothetical protein D6816_08290, partial [Bacteroidetes bacterium]
MSPTLIGFDLPTHSYKDSAITSNPVNTLTTMKSLSTLCFTTLSILFFNFQIASAATIYVDASATGANDGSSWTDAYTDLQDALSAAVSGDDIWVAAGTYKPTSTTDRNISFSMKNGVAIYGGFAGTETTLSQRDWTANSTILSGNIGTSAVTDNSYHVFYNTSNDATAVLDGFTISDGYANGGGNNNYGGGMCNDKASPTIKNCIFSSNNAYYGGALYNVGTSSANASPSLISCAFKGNLAFYYGGALYNQNYCSPAITNSLFSGNKANGNYGGAVYVYSGSPTITNCTFAANNGSNGGAIYQYNATTNVKNSIFWGNYNYQIYRQYGTLTVNYSIVQNGYSYSGTGNLSIDPLFVSLPSYTSAPTTAGDFHIQFPSPALNVGTASGAPATDYDGDTRPYGPGVDMGFDELEYPCPSSNVIYVDTDATGNDDGSSWTDAYKDLQDALLQARYCSIITQIWVAEGTYKPTNTSNRGIS